MLNTINRRQLLGASAVAVGLTFDTRPLKAQMKTAGLGKSRLAAAPPPRGRLGKLEVSRLICGGNLFSGFAHSGDLLYVSSLLKHYFACRMAVDSYRQKRELRWDAKKEEIV
jgi:hypothetical protein